MKDTTKEIKDIFAIFHDGRISEWKGDLAKLTLKIECQYLAQEFNEVFENFYVIINTIKHIEFEPWITSVEKDNKTEVNKTELKDIFEGELDILDAKINKGIVTINCNQDNPEFDYCGGTLFLKAEQIHILDHLKEKLQLIDLYKASKNYWNNFGEKEH